jgi:hypothetical protein
MLRPVAAPVRGPASAAIQASCELNTHESGEIPPVFHRIANHIDFELTRPAAETFFRSGLKRLVVGASDASWRRGTLLSCYDQGDLDGLAQWGDLRLRQALSECVRKYPAASDHVPLGYLATLWSKQIQRVMRSGRRSPAALSANDILGGVLFECSDLLPQIRSILETEDTPVLAIAMNSTSSKCWLRTFAFPLRNWVHAAGAVAGHA